MENPCNLWYKVIPEIFLHSQKRIFELMRIYSLVRVQQNKVLVQWAEILSLSKDFTVQHCDQGISSFIQWFFFESVQYEDNSLYNHNFIICILERPSFDLRGSKVTVNFFHAIHKQGKTTMASNLPCTKEIDLDLWPSEVRRGPFQNANSKIAIKKWNGFWTWPQKASHRWMFAL